MATEGGTSGLLWTIDELGQAAATAVALAGIGQSNGQIREVPNRRTLRYYTTLGLLDRPAEMRGRKAFYGVRHLQQVVAIKRLQAEGLPLPDVQARLAGLGDEELTTLADVPEAGLRPGATASVTGPEPGPSRRESAFWEVPAVDPGAPSSATAQDAGDDDADHSADARDHGAPVQLTLPGVVPAVALAPGAVLVLEGARALSPQDLEVIRLAAVPLLDVLQQRGLLGAPPHNPGGLP